jgi:hypothetical protein
MPRAGDETWRQLRDWTGDQKASERLAGQLLRGEGYSDIDPSHPLGGPDGGRDARLNKDGKQWAMAVHFARGKQTFAALEKKFRADLASALEHKPEGFVFVTNQALTVSQKAKLARDAAVAVEVYHLERVVSLLDSPRNYGVRLEYLGIGMTLEEQASLFRHMQDLVNEKLTELRGAIDGVDTFCYLMLTWFDMENDIVRTPAVVKKGRYALQDVSMRVVDLDSSPPYREQTYDLGNLVAAAQMINPWRLVGDARIRRFNIFFIARNGSWVQMLRIARGPDAWLSATRVVRGSGVVLEEVDPAYVALAGQPDFS